MATHPSGKKPAPQKATPKAATPTKPAASNKAVGVRAPAKVKPKAKPRPKVKSTPAKRVTTPAKAKPNRFPSPTTPADTQPRELTLKQQRFVEEYMVDLNGTQAATRAGYSAHTANEQAARLLANASIQLAVTNARKKQQERTHVTADRWLMEVASIALADSRELVEVRTGCCRCCYGEDHKYQRTVGEMNRDREAWTEKGKNPSDFDEAGGIGFNPLLMPVEYCPVCGGDGAARAVLKDTRNLSPQAVALYAGAKQTQYGIEIKMHSKTDALEKLAKHLGVYEKDNSQKVDPLAALLARFTTGSDNGFKPIQSDPERPASSIGPNATPPGDDDED